MSKKKLIKIKINKTYLSLLVVFIFTIVLIAYGAILRHHYYGGDKFKSLRMLSVFLAEIPTNTKKIINGIKDKNIITQDIYVENDLHIGKKGFVIYKDFKFDGILVLARYDGNNNRSIVEIIDLDRKIVLHTYEPDFQKILNKINYNNERFIYLKRDRPKNIFPMKNPILTSDGGIIFHGSNTPLIKINYCSQIEWIEDTNPYHHTINLSNDGNYWVPSQLYPNSIDKVYLDESLLDSSAGERFENKLIDDAITKVSPDGKIIFEKSLIKIFLDNNLGYLIFGQQDLNLDPFHLNDIEEARYNSKYFKKGDLFLSARNLSTIIQYRPNTNKIIRLINGQFYMQHDIDFIDHKTISIFDNNRINTPSDSKVLDYNKIKYYDFENKSFYERFSEILISLNVNTKAQGLVETINKDTILIEEHEQNRIIIADEQNVILEYYNTADDGKRYNLYWSRYMSKHEIKGFYEKLKKKKCN